MRHRGYTKEFQKNERLKARLAELHAETTQSLLRVGQATHDALVTAVGTLRAATDER